MTGKFCSFECSAAWHSNEAFLRRWPDGNPFSPGIVAECRAALAKLPVLTLEQVSS
jgi:hypothetical protein